MKKPPEIMKTALIVGGWIKQDDGTWLSPLTNRCYSEAVAYMLCTLPALTTLSEAKRKQRFKPQPLYRRR